MYVLHRRSPGAVRGRTHPACLAAECDRLDGLRLRRRAVWFVSTDDSSPARVGVAAQLFARPRRRPAAARVRGRPDFGAAIPPVRQESGPDDGAPGLLDSCRRGTQRRDRRHCPGFCPALSMAESLGKRPMAALYRRPRLPPADSHLVLGLTIITDALIRCLLIHSRAIGARSTRAALR